MNTRSKRYRRFACELTDVQIDRIKALADSQEPEAVFYTEMVRRLINHALDCPFFVPSVSSGRNPQPTE